MFVLYDNDTKDISLFPKLEYPKLVIYPLEAESTPYRAYKFQSETDFIKWKTEKSEDVQSLYAQILKEVNTFVDIDERELHTAKILETYNAHKQRTIGYVFFVGEFESGKTRACVVVQHIGYRAALFTRANIANIYQFLEHGEATGTIIDDNMTRKSLKDPDRMQVYCSGSEKGARVPRILDADSERRHQKYYYTFGPKFFNSQYLPPRSEEAFISRCHIIHTAKSPLKIPEITEDDLLRFDRLKLKLLKWRMETYFEPLPDVDVELKGRMRDVWKPLLQLVSLLDEEANKTIRGMLDEAMRELNERESSTQNASIATAVSVAVMDTGKPEVPFDIIWRVLAAMSNVTPSSTKIIDEDVYITKTGLGLTLQANLNGKPHKKHGRMTYSFNIERLKRVLRGYGITTEQILEVEKKYKEATPWERTIELSLLPTDLSEKEEKTPPSPTPVATEKTDDKEEPIHEGYIAKRKRLLNEEWARLYKKYGKK